MINEDTRGVYDDDDENENEDTLCEHEERQTATKGPKTAVSNY